MKAKDFRIIVVNAIAGFVAAWAGDFQLNEMRYWIFLLALLVIIVNETFR